MKRVVRWGFRGVLGVVILSVFAGCGLVVALMGLDLGGYMDEGKALAKERREAEEALVKARVVFDNLEQYTKDRGVLDRYRAEKGLVKSKEEVLSGLRAGQGAEVVEGPEEKGAVLLTLSKAGGAATLLDLARAADGAGLVPARGTWGSGRAALSAWILPRIVGWRGPVAVKKRADVVPVPVMESKPSWFDLTGAARERERLAQTRRELAALDAAAPGVVEMMTAYETDNRALEGVLKIKDELLGRGFRLDDFEKVAPALALLESGKASSKGRRITLDGAFVQGKDPGQLRGALEEAFKVVELGEGPAVHAVVERLADAPEK